jgi:predicted ribosomally synthesized peptide with nif11-like leader
MSIDSLNNFMKLVATDESIDTKLQQAIGNQEGPAACETVASFGKERGYDFTPEEVAEFRKTILSYNQGQESGELSESELEAVAGGHAQWGNVANRWLSDNVAKPVADFFRGW